MAIEWANYLVEPMIHPGAGRASVTLVLNGAAVTAIRCKLGTVPAAGADDAGFFDMDLRQPVGGDGSTWVHSFFGAPPMAALVASWFAKVAGVWVAGPAVSAVDLSVSPTVFWPWPKEWLTARLREVLGYVDPGLNASQELEVRDSFPRDTTPWPLVVVEIGTTSEDQKVAQDAGSNAGPFIGDSLSLTRSWRFQGTVTAYAITPEERDLLAQWLGKAMAVVAHIANDAEVQELSFDLACSEDFESYGHPAFLVTVSINGIVWSEIATARATSFGRVSVP